MRRIVHRKKKKENREMATATRSKAKSESNGDAIASLTRELVIPKPQKRALYVTLEGLSPLVTHNGESAIRDIKANEARKQGGIKTLPPRDPQARFEESTYRDAEGNYVFPALGIKKSVISAGFRYSDEKGTVLRGIINIDAPTGYVKIISPNPPTMREDFVKHGGITPDIAYRAEFWPWSMDVTFIYLASSIRRENLINMIDTAGESVCIGAWRVEKSGMFGRFRVGENVRDEAVR